MKLKRGWVFFFFIYIYTVYAAASSAFALCLLFILSGIHFSHYYHLKQFGGFKVLSPPFLSFYNDVNPFFAYKVHCMQIGSNSKH